MRISSRITKIVITSMLIALFSLAITLAVTSINAYTSNTNPNAVTTSAINWDDNNISITNEEELKQFRDIVNGATGSAPKNFANQTIYLQNDIHLTDPWIPIGRYHNYECIDSLDLLGFLDSAKFSGTFDGNGHVISGMKIEMTQYYDLAIKNSPVSFDVRFDVGFFGYVYNAVIQNLILEKPEIILKDYPLNYEQYLNQVNPDSNGVIVCPGSVGTFIGNTDGNTTINNCVVSGIAKISAYVGCYTNVNLATGTIRDQIGGFVGRTVSTFANTTINNCCIGNVAIKIEPSNFHSKGLGVFEKPDNYELCIGGFTGTISNLTVANCYANPYFDINLSGPIKIGNTEKLFLGAFAGWADSSVQIKACLFNNRESLVYTEANGNINKGSFDNLYYNGLANTNKGGAFSGENCDMFVVTNKFENEFNKDPNSKFLSSIEMGMRTSYDYPSKQYHFLSSKFPGANDDNDYYIPYMPEGFDTGDDFDENDYDYILNRGWPIPRQLVKWTNCTINLQNIDQPNIWYGSCDLSLPQTEAVKTAIEKSNRGETVDTAVVEKIEDVVRKSIEREGALPSSSSCDVWIYGITVGVEYNGAYKDLSYHSFDVKFSDGQYTVTIYITEPISVTLRRDEQGVIDSKLYGSNTYDLLPLEVITDGQEVQFSNKIKYESSMSFDLLNNKIDIAGTEGKYDTKVILFGFLPEYEWINDIVDIGYQYKRVSSSSWITVNDSSSFTLYENIEIRPVFTLKKTLTSTFTINSTTLPEFNTSCTILKNGRIKISNNSAQSKIEIDFDYTGTALNNLKLRYPIIYKTILDNGGVDEASEKIDIEYFGYELTQADLVDSGGNKCDWQNDVTITSDSYTFTPNFSLITYTLPLYISENSIRFTINSYRLFSFDITTEKSFSSRTESTNPAFGYWIFDAKSANENIASDMLYRDNPGFATATPTKKQPYILKLTHSNGVIYLEITGKLRTLSDFGRYYIVDRIMQGSYGSIEHNGSYDEPYIFAKYSKEYTVTVDAVGYNDGGTVHNTGTSYNTDYIGTIDSSDPERKRLTFNLAIRDQDQYSYNFLASEIGSNGYSFYNYADLRSRITDSNFEYLSKAKNSSNSRKWTVYNYGYRINGWVIKVDYLGNSFYLQFEKDTGWDYGSNINVISVDKLTGSTDLAQMSRYAELLDEMFVTGSPTKITMSPVWEAVIIKPVVESRDISSKFVTYGGSYTFDNAGNIGLNKIGSTLVYFTCAKDNDTAIMYPEICSQDKYLPWNYRNISHDAYVLDKLLGRTYYYKINLTPQYSSNIYRVNLSGIRPNDDGEYELSSEVQQDYSLYAGSNLYSEGEYSALHVDFGFKGYNAEDYEWIEDYAFKKYIQNYNAYTQNTTTYDGLEADILRKVFINGDEIYIYLAHNAPTGKMPIFKCEQYILTHYDLLNDGQPTNLIYITNLFISAEGVADKVQADTWQYENCPAELQANYFRKYFALDVKSYLNDRLSDAGYLLLDVADSVQGEDNHSAKYLIIYDAESALMKIYSLDSNQNLESFSILNFNFEAVPVNRILVYTGSTLKIRIVDQSQDLSAVKSGEFDNFIGYKFSYVGYDLFGTNERKDFEDGYCFEFSSADLLNADIPHGAIKHLDVNFENIKYSLKVEVDESAGNVTVLVNNAVIASGTSVELQNLLVGDEIEIIFNANLGYEFNELEDKAFVLTYINGGGSISEIVLQKYSTFKDENGNIIQNYMFNIDALWLKTNYYGISNQSYSVTESDIGTINVETQEIEFNVAIKAYDTVDGTQSTYLGEKQVDTYTLSKGNVTLQKAFLNLVDGEEIYGVTFNDVNYVAIASSLFSINNATTRPSYSDDAYKQYVFALKSTPTDMFNIDLYLLTGLVEFEQNKIVPQANRTIYFKMEVRKLFTLTIKAEAENEHDQNNGKRTTDFAIDEYVSSFIANGEDYASLTTTAYTYEGGNNRLTTTLDSVAINRYSGVEYYLGDNKLPNRTDSNYVSLNFSISEDNSTIYIKYLVKSLITNVTYYKDGALSSTQLEEITDLSIDTANPVLYIGDSVTISFEIDEDYVADVIINNKEQGNSSLEANKYSYTYTMQDSDYDFGAINIEIHLNRKENSNVRIAYKLEGDKALNSDDYGSFEVYVDDEVQPGSYVNVILGKSLSVKLNLNSGYVYKNTKLRANGKEEIVETASLDADNVILLTESFVPNQNEIITYYICIEKEDIIVNLAFEEGQIKNYTLSSSGLTGEQDELGNTVSLTAYVGKEISILRVNGKLPTEQPNYYYYELQGEEHRFVSPLTLTSEIISKLGEDKTLTIKVNSTRKYLVKLQLNNPDLTVIETSPEVTYNGIYVLNKQEINIQLDSTVTTKYISKLTIQGNVVRENYDAISTVLKIEDGKIYLDGEQIADYLGDDVGVMLVVDITPREFGLETNEYLFDALDKPADKEENPINALENAGSNSYLGQAQLVINRKTDERTLTEIELSTVSGLVVKIDISGKMIVTAEKDGVLLEGSNIKINGNIITIQVTEGEETTTYTYTVTLTEQSVIITYTIMEDASINLYYTSLKILYPND